MLIASIALPIMLVVVWAAYDLINDILVPLPKFIDLFIVVLFLEIVLLIFGMFFYGYKTQVEVSREKGVRYVYSIPDSAHPERFTLEIRKNYWRHVLKNLVRSVFIAFIYSLFSSDGELFESKFITASIVAGVILSFTLINEGIEYLTDISKVVFSSRQIVFYRRLFSNPKIMQFSGEDRVILIFAKGENSFLQLQMGKKKFNLRLDNKKLAHQFEELKEWLDAQYEPLTDEGT